MTSQFGGQRLVVDTPRVRRRAENRSKNEPHADRRKPLQITVTAVSPFVHSFSPPQARKQIKGKASRVKLGGEYASGELKSELNFDRGRRS